MKCRAFRCLSPMRRTQKLAVSLADLVSRGRIHIQLGIGGFPNAAALALREKKDLGVHTEMLVDSMMDYTKPASFTNARKDTQDRASSSRPSRWAAESLRLVGQQC